MHKPVMLKEVIQHLKPQDGEHFLDCTFGSGGHSAAILNTSHCKITAIDRDPEVEQYATYLTKLYTHDRFQFLCTDFVHAASILHSKFDGIIMDLGISSMQINNERRGFSFKQNGPLDMRMNMCGYSALDFINHANRLQLENIIFTYGNEYEYKNIANSIIHERNIKQITTTEELATIIRNAKRKINSAIDPATKTFQAIRIHINDELKQLELFLNQSFNILNTGGRLIIISFHSLEDKIVKSFLKQYIIKNKKSKYIQFSKHQTINHPPVIFEILNKKPLTPSINELKNNPKSRSAKFRAAILLKNHDTI